MMRYITWVLLFFMIASCQRNKVDQQSGKQAVTAQLLPENSSETLYQLGDAFQDQQGDSLSLIHLEGKPVVMSMIYTSCAGACPRLVADMQQIEKTLGRHKDRVRFVLISFDSERDSVSVLREYVRQHHLGDNWLLLRGSQEVIRTLSVLLDVSFKNEGNGIFSHENKISILDKKGRLRLQLEGLDDQSGTAFSALQQLLHS